VLKLVGEVTETLDVRGVVGILLELVGEVTETLGVTDVVDTLLEQTKN
jgi:hypothetical protein